MSLALGKYDRKIFGRKKVEDCIGGFIIKSEGIYVDVYDVLVAFNVTCPARAHAIKKLLCAGLRGKGDALQDLIEAVIAIDRAIDFAKRDANK